VASAWAALVARSGLLRVVLAQRFVVLGVAAVGVALLEVHTTGPSTDGWYFIAAGRDLLSSHGLHVYDTAGLQAGPLQIGAFGILGRLTELVHLPSDSTYAVISTLASVALVAVGTRLLRRYVGLAESTTAELLTGLLAIGWLVATEAYTSGHPAELIIPALWIGAAVLATRHRSAWAGALIGLGAGFETWAVLGVPVLLLSGDWRKTARSLAVVAVVVAALYLPFVVAGPFRMGQLAWNVSSNSLVHALDPQLTGLPWSGRLVQSAVVVSLGVLVWIGRRREANPTVAVWLLPAVIALAKAISEPSGYEWYWLPAQIALLAGLGCADGLNPTVIAAAVVAEAVAVTSPLHGWPIALVALAGLLAVSWSPTAERLPGRLRPLRSSG
jgi:hypothetical protein